MLIQREKDIPYVVVLKMTTNEEVVATIISEDMNTMTVLQPLVMVGVGYEFEFSPYVVMSNFEKPVVIFKRAMIAKTYPGPEALESYKKVVQSMVKMKKP